MEGEGKGGLDGCCCLFLMDIFDICHDLEVDLAEENFGLNCPFVGDFFRISFDRSGHQKSPTFFSKC